MIRYIHEKEMKYKYNKKQLHYNTSIIKWFYKEFNRRFKLFTCLTAGVIQGTIKSKQMFCCYQTGYMCIRIKKEPPGSISAGNT